MSNSIVSANNYFYSIVIRLRRLFPIFKAFKIFKAEGFAGVKQRLVYRLQGFSPWWENRAWLKKYTPSESDLLLMQDKIESFSYRPLISILLPVYNPEEDFIIDAIESVMNQVYQNWELCIADDASTKEYVRNILNDYKNKDVRIKVCFRVTNGHISECSNSALDLATGEFTALLDHDDVLAPHALFCMVEALNEDPQLDLIYSNEDKIDLRNYRSEPCFKAKWSPEYFLSFMYLGHLALYRTSLINQVGGFRIGFEGSQDYDLALRVTELTSRVHHIPKILYHWRKHPESVAVNIMAKPYAFESGQKALNESLVRRCLVEVEAAKTEAPGIYHVKSRTNSDPSVVAYVDQALPPCLKTLPHVTGTTPVESWSELDAKYVLFVSSHITEVSSNWYEEMLAVLNNPGVELVSAKVLNDKKRYVHAGYTFERGVLTSNFYGYRDRHPGYGARLYSLHNINAVGFFFALCRKELLVTSGLLTTGMSSTQAKEAFLCSYVKKNHGRIAWTPHVTATYNGPKVDHRVDLKDYPDDFATLEKNFAIASSSDPYYPLGLDRQRFDFTVEL